VPRRDALASTLQGSSVGGRHLLLLYADGRCLGFGQDTDGALDRPADSDVQETLLEVSSGEMHSLFLTEGGKVLASPPKMPVDDNYGQCDVPDEATTGISSIAAGSSCSAALTYGGELIIWGAVPDAWLADDHSQRFATVAASMWDVAAVREDGLIRGWGDSESFWGWNDFVSGVQPPTRRGSGMTRKLALEDDHVLGLTDGGEVWSLGKSWWAHPDNVPDEAKEGVTHIATSTLYSLALREDGSIVCWGAAPPSVDVTRYAIPSHLNGVVTHLDSGSMGTILVDSAGRVHICRLSDGAPDRSTTGEGPPSLTIWQTISAI
jgi:alpha-tubulin suppressor-like RCC1 family protein